MGMTTDARILQQTRLDDRLEPLGRPKTCDGISLVLQGASALNAYQAGVYQAPHEATWNPTGWSVPQVGAVNSSIIAGNPQDRRLERLEEFWTSKTANDPVRVWPEGGTPRKFRNAFSAMNAMLFAQRDSKGATAMYDTPPLRKSLGRLLDFDLLNSGKVRFALGAGKVSNANLAYFDSANITIGPEHVLAGGALPPVLPMVRIGKNTTGMAV